MNIEYLGAKIFLDEINASQQIWVAKNSYGSIYTPQLNEPLLSLPVFSNREKVEAFLNSARLVGPASEPHAIPLGEFTLTWLNDPQRAIGELQINPDGRSSRVLVMTKEEFQEAQTS